MKTTHKIIFGDSRQMNKVNDNSVHLVVTSPPYWQLKDYGSDAQIGFHESYEDYINNLNLVWKECHRIIHDGCRLCINIGDQFARSVYYGRYKVIPIRTEIIRLCETIGFDFMGSIIWQKVTTCNTTGGASIMGSFPYPRNGIVKIDYEFILLFKKLGKSPKVDKKVKELSAMSTKDWNLYFNGHWNFPGEKQSEHLAMFPEELPRRLIRMFSFHGENVLDPFLASGTTSLAAIKLNRNSIGYEINESFKANIEHKLFGAKNLFNEAEIAFENDSIEHSSRLLEKLPYLFKDPLAFDKKVDPRKLMFGSKISVNDKTEKKSEYYRVSEIVSVDKFRLNDNLLVKLMGVIPLQDKKSEALEFLKKKVKGKLVTLKFDNMKYDESNDLLVYLYLKNKTFINAHLIKYGLASVDVSKNLSNRTLLKLAR